MEKGEGNKELSPTKADKILSSLKINATNYVLKVVVVEKQWYDSLIKWLKDPQNPKPSEMNLNSLKSGNKFKSDLKLHTDFEVIPSSAWPEIAKLFKRIQPYQRNLIKHPKTGEPIVLFSSDTLRISFQNRFIQKSVLKDWVIGDVLTQLCRILSIDRQKYRFLSQSQHSIIDDSLLVSDILKRFDGNVILTELDSISSNKDSIDTQKNSTDSNASSLEESSNFTTSSQSSPSIDLSGNSMKSLSVTDFFNLHTVQPFPKPAGLHNLGNTCFFNAAIQCLIRIQPLTAFVMSPTFESHINFNNPLGSHGAIALAYRNFLMDICGGRNNTRDPRLLRSAIASKYRKFANYWQQDSQELLGALLDGLHEDLNQAARPKNSTENETVSSNADSWSLYLSKNSSPIMDLFSGKLYSRINCNLCGYSSIVHELFMFLSLSVPSRAEKSIKLIDCIKFFLKEEQLDESNKWKCEKCNHYVKATKKIEIEQCPPVLIIHLKRFEGRLRYATKIDTTVDYPDELDASLFTMKKNNDVYRLIGVVFHAGGLNGGHYTSAALDLPSGQWYYFNDSSASKISIAAAHNSKAYILFYQRK